MPDYVLFAARDGETFVSSKSCPNRQFASDWAVTEVISAFSLTDAEIFDLADLQGEIDGLYLGDLADLSLSQ